VNAGDEIGGIRDSSLCSQPNGTEKIEGMAQKGSGVMDRIGANRGYQRRFDLFKDVL
jgi:hypothetical protein